MGPQQVSGIFHHPLVVVCVSSCPGPANSVKEVYNENCYGPPVPLVVRHLAFLPLVGCLLKRAKIWKKGREKNPFKHINSRFTIFIKG